MGTASEALTSLQGVACNMAILAGAAGGLSPKFDVHVAYTHSTCVNPAELKSPDWSRCKEKVPELAL